MDAAENKTIAGMLTNISVGACTFTDGCPGVAVKLSNADGLSTSFAIPRDEAMQMAAAMMTAAGRHEQGETVN